MKDKPNYGPNGNDDGGTLRPQDVQTMTKSGSGEFGLLRVEDPCSMN